MGKIISIFDYKEEKKKEEEEKQGGVYSLLDGKSSRDIMESYHSEIRRITRENKEMLDNATFEKIMEDINARRTNEPSVPKFDVKEPIAEEKQTGKLEELYEKLKQKNIGTTILKEVEKGYKKVSPLVKKAVIYTLAGLIVYSYSDDYLKKKVVQYNAGTINTIVSTGDRSEGVNSILPKDMGYKDGKYIAKVQIANILKGEKMTPSQRNSEINMMILEYMGLASKRYVHIMEATYKNATEEKDVYALNYEYRREGWLQDYYDAVVHYVSPICSIDFPEQVTEYLANNGFTNNNYNYNHFTNKMKITEREKEGGNYRMIHNLIEYSDMLIRNDSLDRDTNKIIKEMLGDVDFDHIYERDINGNVIGVGLRLLGKYGQVYEIINNNGNISLELVENTKGER